MSKQVLRYIYALWVSFSIAYAWYFYLFHIDAARGYLPTFIIFTGISFLIPIFIRHIPMRAILPALFISVLIVSFIFNTHHFPEIMIMAIGRIIILGTLIISLFPIQIHINRMLRIVLINIIVFILCLEALLGIIHHAAGPDILKSRTDIITLSPGDTINGRTVNSSGYMGNEPGTDSSGEKWLFIGDSFGFGALHYDSNFIYMSQSAFNIVSVNVSSPGFAPDDYLMQLIKYKDANDFSRVFVIVFTGNDISEASLLNAPVQNNWSYKKRYIYRMLVNMRDMWRYGEFAHSGKGLISRHYIDIESRRAMFNASSDEQLWVRFTKNMSDIACIAEDDSMDLTVILIPDVYTVDYSLQDSILMHLGMEHMDFMYTHRRAKHIVDLLGIDCIDTYDTLSSAAHAGTVTYIENNTHINTTGNLYVLHAMQKHFGSETIYKK